MDGAISTLMRAPLRSVTCTYSTTDLDRDRLARPDLKSRLRTLTDDDARGDSRIRAGADHGDAKAAVAQDVGGAVAVDADQVRHHVAGAALAAVDEQRHLTRGAARRRRLCHDDV